ncbi:heat shock protein 30 [Cristinia sonorae]|uniref:Heat shock protein 30 n=1 Tax=Cristinia sonorae TaxID=1940300 RepID=A0A8K0UZ06_9AGAR|nr:heat shock protein 30 [Cristinia sonorae]
MAGPLANNPPNADRHITNGAIAWLWVVFSFFFISTLLMLAWHFIKPRGTRFFHNIALIIFATSSLAYFSMASNLGATPVRVEFEHAGFSQTRQIFYVRYIQWFINFPLILIMLLSASGLALSDILTTAFMAWFAVVSGLVGALVASSYKWGYFVMAILALMYIWASINGHARRTTFHAGDGVRSGFIRGAGFLTVFTLMYPLVWGLSEGGNVLSPTGEMVWYGILDLILGPLFIFYFIFGLRSVDYETFGFRSNKYTDMYGPQGAVNHSATSNGAAIPASTTSGAAAAGHTPGAGVHHPEMGTASVAHGNNALHGVTMPEPAGPTTASSAV